MHVIHHTTPKESKVETMKNLYDQHQPIRSGVRHDDVTNTVT